MRSLHVLELGEIVIDTCPLRHRHGAQPIAEHRIIPPSRRNGGTCEVQNGLVARLHILQRGGSRACPADHCPRDADRQ